MILPRYDLKILTKSLCYNATRLMCTLFIKSLNSNKIFNLLNNSYKLYLKPLPLPDISKAYQKVFKLSFKEACSLVFLTKGYPYAYQLLSFILLMNKTNSLSKEILNIFDNYLKQYLYLNLYKGLSITSRLILETFNTNSEVNTKAINRISFLQY